MSNAQRLSSIIPAGILVLFTALGCAHIDASSVIVEPWYPAVNQNGDPVFAVFESRIPCAGDCRRLKFGLALYRSRGSKATSTYMMARVYVGQGDDRIVNEGVWSITRGTQLDAEAVVYRLDSGAPEEFRSYWAIGEDILFILDREMEPRVGTAGYGYVLNRTR